MSNKRIEKVCERMTAANLSQIIITDPWAIFYLTGKMFQPGERYLALILKTNGDHKIFINKLFPVPEDLGIEKVWFTDTDAYMEMTASYLDKNETVGIDKKMAASFLLELQRIGAAAGYVNSSFCVDDQRGCKDEDEQNKMIEASRINDEAMARFRGLIHEGVTEREVAQELVKIYLELGADGISFGPIVSFGKNAADPHHKPDDTVLQPGDCVLFDVGCKKDGYCSDMTRTFFYKSVTEKQKEVYNIVLQANLAAEAIMKPGMRFCDIDAAARGLITEAGYGPNFTHRLGHSIGLEVHEPGDANAINTNKVEPGRIFSCEPGIYLPGEFGVRIEDLCMITEDGVMLLNHYSKELDIIDPE